MQRVADLFQRFRRDERGVFAIFFALIAIVIIAAAGAVVDFTRVQQARTRAQIAVDGAALALQAKIDTMTQEELTDEAQLLLTERMGDSSITAVVESAVPDEEAGKLTISGYISVPTYFVALVGIHDIRSAVLSEVTQQSSNLEIALSIDITGSMALEDCEDAAWWEDCEESDKIGDLIAASRTLITTLVPDDPDNSNTKMAIVPWSNVVNPGSYLTDVRGTPDNTSKNITAASWSTGTAKSIQSITRGWTTTTINSNSHGLSNGDTVYINSVGALSYNGSSCINGRAYVITWVTNNRYTINLNTGSCSNATNNTGTGTKCQVANCDLVITTNSAHGYAADEGIHVSSASWLGTKFMIRSVPTTTTIALKDKFGPTSSAFVAGGKTWCGRYGCSYRVFQQGSNVRDYPVAPCVTERATNYDTDVSPGVTPLGYYYVSSATCLSNQIVPLTPDRDVLLDAIGPYEVEDRTLVASGSTAGHLGLAWGWYMIAPNFSFVWPVDSRPVAYNTENVVKAIVFMTDGLFNTQYCSGVTDGAACTNANGDSQEQAEDICDSIKEPANDTLLYVIGFDLADDEDTLEFLRDCATSVDHFYQADTGEDLAEAFASIAGDLSALRVSK